MSAPYPQAYNAPPPSYTQHVPQMQPAPPYSQPVQQQQPGVAFMPQSNIPPQAPENPRPTDGHNQNINITIGQPPAPVAPVAVQPLQSAPVIVAQPLEVGAVRPIIGSSFQDTPAAATCPSCNQKVISRLQYTVGLFSWVIFGILIFFGCWLGCCIIPFVMNRCKDVDHYCPSCNFHLHRYERL
ncbi:lipopolysaccharide-induced tumor necrosis factor-alpha factor homolog isoform X2 [Xenopus laevis]|uniref:Lipopolysaccharide-induced tumor necrosis factor-alpha factor homolog isoform X2 n=1 Tax=Xenopus laevis TaxID=8355 RepID=A0A8J1LU24_XENLA|nr:lipopolysaccharide-induced tumor necrosis factor-alpha factor homolog isoform X2 [Xenopus laevis]